MRLSTFVLLTILPGVALAQTGTTTDPSGAHKPRATPPRVGASVTTPGANGSPFLAPILVSGTVKEIDTGVNATQFTLVTNEPIANPAACPLSDGYATDGAQPGYDTYYVAAITAFVERAKIVVVVAREKCIAGRPHLIGINLIR
jgi:hypothetical protein